MDSMIDSWKAVVEGFTQRLEAVSDDQWDADSNCDGWSVRDLAAHAIDVQRMIPTALGADMPEVGADLGASWQDVVAAAQAAFEVDGAMQQVVAGPVGEMPADQALGIPTNDLLIHTFDLARSTGGDETLPSEFVEHAFESLKPIDAMIRGEGMFGPKVDVADDAPLQDQFIAFTGRQP